MNLSTEQIESIKRYAKALTPITDVAVLMGINEDDLREEMSNKQSPIRLAYETGRAITEFEIRSTEINLAANGSPMAIQHVKEYMNDLILSNDL